MGWAAATLILLPLGCFGAYHLGMLLSAAPPIPKDEPSEVPALAIHHLSVDATELQLGEVWESPDFVAEIALKNIADVPVSVMNFSTSRSCSGVEPTSLVVPPKGSARLKVKMDLTHRLPHQMGVERRLLSIVIHPVFADVGASSGGWEFTGVVRSRVSLNTSRLDFTDQCLRDGTPVSRKIRATIHAPVAQLEAVATPAHAQVKVIPVAGDSGHYDISVTPDPKLPIGPCQFDVAVSATMPDGTHFRCASVAVRGEMEPSTRVVPSLVLLGERVVGKKAEAEATVRLRPGSAIDQVIAESADTKVEPNGEYRDGTLRFRISQKIASQGDRSNGVRFIVRKPDGGREQVKIEVRYRGNAPTKIKDR